MNNLICICCPKGCRLEITESNGDLTIKGASCPRGVPYAKSEILDPKRFITSSVRCLDDNFQRCPVKTSAEVPKAKIDEVIQAIQGHSISLPVKVGDILLENVANTGIDVVCTRTLPPLR